MAILQEMLESIRIVRRFADWDNRPPSWHILNPRDPGQRYGIALIVTWADTHGHDHGFIGLLGSATHRPGIDPPVPSFPLIRQSLDDSLAELLWLELWPDGGGGVYAEVVGEPLGKPFEIQIADDTDGDVLVR